MDSNRKVSIVLNILASVCFIVASIISFVGENTRNGWIFLVIAIAQIILGIMQFGFMKKETK